MCCVGVRGAGLVDSVVTRVEVCCVGVRGAGLVDSVVTR